MKEYFKVNVDRLIVKCGLVQSDAKINCKEDNKTRAVRAFEQCAVEGCQLICFPEAFLTSVNLPRLKEVGESIPGPTSDFLCCMAKEKKMYVVAGIIEIKESRVCSSAVLINDEGKILYIYRRMHLYSLESRFLTPGTFCEVMDTPLGRLGIIIGYDINFPETTRLLFKQKVEIIICPAQLLESFTKTVRFMTISRAAENCCYLLFCSSVGSNTLAGLTYMGNSVIVRNPIKLSPYNFGYQNAKEIIAEAKPEETIIYGDLDLTQLRREQEENPHYADALNLSYSRI